MNIEGLVIHHPVGPPLGEVRGTNLGGFTVIPPPPPPPPALCSAELLAALQDEYLADDIDLDLGVMTQWTEAQARSYFESGGATVPVVPPVYADLPTLLSEVNLEGLEALVSRDSLDLWLERFHHPDGRSAVLHRLKRVGVEKMGDRQTIYNGLQRAWREGRLRPPTPQWTPLDSPTELLRQAVAHVTALRATPADEISGRLQEIGMDEESAALVTGPASGVEVVKQLSAPQLGSAMEALGMSLASGSTLGGNTRSPIHAFSHSRLLPFTPSPILAFSHFYVFHAIVSGHVGPLLTICYRPDLSPRCGHCLQSGCFSARAHARLATSRSEEWLSGRIRCNESVTNVLH